MEENKLIELVNDEKIIEVLESKNYLNLAKYLGQELCGFTSSSVKYVLGCCIQ